MNSPREKEKGDSIRATPAALEEQRLADQLVRRLLIDATEAQLAGPRPGDEVGPKHLLQRLRLRGILTTSQSHRLAGMLDELLGQGIPGYELIEKIGQGSTAQVFKARQTGTDRLVALKVMPPRVGRNPTEGDKFLALARGWAKMRHPRLVQVLDAGTSPFPFCALEFMPVPSMDRDPRIVRGKPLGERELARIGIQVAEGLAYLHKKGVIHRDIKPANLFLLEDGQVQVGDLGLALWGDVDPHRAKEQGLALGTPYYMSPEQITNDPPLDSRSDLYSLGITLFQLATGKVPYSGDNPDQVQRHHLESPVPSLATVRPDLSAGFANAIISLLAKDPNRRPVNAETVAELFSRLEAKAIVGGSGAHRAGR